MRVIEHLICLLCFAFEIPVEASPPSNHSWIIELKPGVSTADFADDQGLEVEHEFDHFFRGFSTRMPAVSVVALNRLPEVIGVHLNARVWLEDAQTSAPWSLDRLDQRTLPLDRKFTYLSTGKGVAAYIVDTGVRVSHQEFEGRAALGTDVTGGRGEDCHGHGTHVAGLVGGKTYGPAKKAKLVSVRVLPCSGSGSIADVIRGLEWIDQNLSLPSVVNISIGVGGRELLDRAVLALIRSGAVVVTSAGNFNTDACDFSPARVAEVLSVGILDSRDRRSRDSNYGDCVDVFAPGVNVRSASRRSDTLTETRTGSSMSSPIAAGVVAQILGLEPQLSPAEATQRLTRAAVRGGVSGARSPDALLLQSF
jgi:subtilisin family serine protease